MSPLFPSRTAWRHIGWALRRTVFALVSPLVEKNPLKLSSFDTPVVLSMARLVILIQLLVWVYIGIMRPAMTMGWPYWTFGGILTIALPLVDALKRSPDGAVLDLAKTVFNRFGVGEVQKVSPFPPLDRTPEKDDA